MIASGPFDLSRLAPVIVIVALFVSVWQVLRRTRRRRARIVGHFVEVWVGDDELQARWLARDLREAGLFAVANQEPEEDDEATLSRERPGDGRPFVAVREHQVDAARRIVAQWIVDWQKDEAEDDLDDEDDDLALKIAPGDEFDEEADARTARAETLGIRLLLLSLLAVLGWWALGGLIS